MTYGRWKIHGLVVNTNLQRTRENMRLASNLPITLTDGAVMGHYWRVHISSNLISCLKSRQESGSRVGNNYIILYAHLVTQPNQASRTGCFSRSYLKMQVQDFSMFTALRNFLIFHPFLSNTAYFNIRYHSGTRGETKQEIRQTQIQLSLTLIHTKLNQFQLQI